MQSPARCAWRRAGPTSRPGPAPPPGPAAAAGARAITAAPTPPPTAPMNPPRANAPTPRHHGTARLPLRAPNAPGASANGASARDSPRRQRGPAGAVFRGGGVHAGALAKTPRSPPFSDEPQQNQQRQRATEEEEVER